MYEELIKSLRKEAEDTYHFLPKILCLQAADAIETLENTLKIYRDSIYSIDNQLPRWISVSERLPECEQEVLICTEKKLVGRNAYIDSIVTPAIYEDGTMRENESKWRWEDIDWDGWDEEEDCGIIPEGWWENRHFNPDDVYNNPVDRKVVAWMPLPEPPKEEK